MLTRLSNFDFRLLVANSQLFLSPRFIIALVLLLTSYASQITNLTVLNVSRDILQDSKKNAIFPAVEISRVLLVDYNAVCFICTIFIGRPVASIYVTGLYVVK